jgi:hypothetical protein
MGWGKSSENVGKEVWQAPQPFAQPAFEWLKNALYTILHT